MLVKRVERHQLKFSKELDELCFKSKNLYNYLNYIVRQAFINDGELLNEYKLSHQLVIEKQKDWDLMKANTNQQVLKQVFKSWKSFFKANKEFKNNPSKFNGRPKLPKYKHKSKGRNIVNFTCNSKANIKNGYFHFPKFTNLKPIKTKITNSNLCCARIIPKNGYFLFEIVYTKEVDELMTSNDYLSIDLGVSNFATCYDSKNNKCFIISGSIIKSYNQFWNKEKAKYQSTLEIVNKSKSSKRLNRLALKRDNKITDFMHKASKYIIDYCKENNITNIVIGHNNFWKQKINIGKVNNQKFVQIPFNKFINQLQYKSENIGINFITVEESYSSKIDHSVFEEMGHQEYYKGKRIQRGLFKQFSEKVLNADLNGAIGILRKVIDESSFKKIVDRGFVINPNKINIYKSK